MVAEDDPVWSPVGDLLQMLRHIIEELWGDGKLAVDRIPRVDDEIGPQLVDLPVQVLERRRVLRPVLEIPDVEIGDVKDPQARLLLRAIINGPSITRDDPIAASMASCPESAGSFFGDLTTEHGTS